MIQALSDPRADSLADVQHLVLDDVSWEFYERLLREIGNRQIRVTYDQGRMEIMAPLAEHEGPKRSIGRLIEMLTFELDIPIASYGSTTFRSKAKAKGLEPDECYYVQNERRTRRRKRLDLRKDPAPDLVVEIDVTSRSLPRRPIYAALGVPEIWLHDDGGLQCLHLINGVYLPRKMSMAFPFLEPAQLLRFVQMIPEVGETQSLRKFVEWIRARQWQR
jgi:Uma2 family endonuclease